MTRAAGLEGTAILLAERGDRLRSVVGDPALDRADEILAGDWLLVVPEALRAAACRGVTALHDVTEGGVGEALHEMALASGLAVEAHRDAVPVRPQTAVVCESLGLDPLGLIGSGSLLVGSDPAHRGDVEATFAEAGVPFTWIGRALDATGQPATAVPRFPRDELIKTTVMDGIEAVIFDMDGTLVDSSYDWPAIGRRLEVTGPSIIDELHGLSEPQRSRRWRELEEIEAAATADATMHDGVGDLLAALADHRISSALVTNNSEANTTRLLDRFELEFDVVLTRDSGLWKPSGAPITEAVRRLGIAPAACLGVGDSHYDILAARDADLGAVCVLHDGVGRYHGETDLSFRDIPSFVRYLRIVLP
jgi:HAD superfamily hydrolase (TIGR01549 family)